MTRQFPNGHWVVGVHTHKYGESIYLFRVTDGETFTDTDFEEFLGDDFDPDDDSAGIQTIQDDEVRVR